MTNFRLRKVILRRNVFFINYNENKIVYLSVLKQSCKWSKLFCAFCFESYKKRIISTLYIKKVNTYGPNFLLIIYVFYFVLLLLFLFLLPAPNRDSITIMMVGGRRVD